MKLTLSWLKKYLETDASAHAIAEKLTALGLEVEQVVDRGKVLAPFVIAHIVEATQHPNADRLKLCSVTDGTKNYQVVCGAPNARTGLKIVLARVGDVIPRDGVALKAGSIRGVESQAMCCSADELNLQHDRADGIIELPDDAPVGKNYAAWAGLDDVTFELKLTPNRPDCAGVYGIARDLAAAGLGTLKPLARANVQGNFPCPVSVMLETEAAPHFALRLVRGVHNGPSPAWLQRLLRDIGLRPISALVDITNFFTFAYARPLHVFDAKKVQGNLRVHAAAGGETLAALNDKTYTLQPGMIAISDDTGVISLAGVVGGATTGCDDTTTDVLIEAAFFNPARTAQTGRELGVVSDARWRFERGIDPHFTEAGLDLATQMVVDVCGQNNTQISHMVVAGAAPDHTRSYVLPHTYGAQLMGVDVPITEQAEILSRLGFVLWEKKNAWDVGVPSWRPDVMGKADLVEEIVRVKGFDMIPATSLPRPQATTPAALNILQKRTQVARRVLAGAGLMEVVTLSFMAGDVAKHFGWHDLSQKIVNPIAADLDVLRPSLLPNVVGVAARNAARGLPHGAWFEVGPVFSG
ncbi:MAG: phenylalanine--tRNA ligase subunit beta, partial [Alphaproteobacteria bacterium]|nr:phenylalanine--tRNA ligase subunit beta [Alphaproteobacteria bacterium]